MTVTKQKPAVPPVAITAILQSSWAVGALRAGIELDVFGAVKDGGTTADDVARMVGADQRGTKLLLDALTGLDLMVKKEGCYELTEVAALYLVPSSPLFMGPYVKRHAEMMKVWEKLPECIKSGKPVEQVNTEAEAAEFFPALAAAIFPMGYATARAVAEKLEVAGLPEGTRVLDLAAGSGVWSIGMAEANAGLKVDALDFSPVLQVTREFTEHYGVAKQYSFLPGNWRDISLPEETYDIAILGHILHSEGVEASAGLLAKCYKAVKPGARLVVAEFIPNEERTAPAMPLLFALNMYLVTTAGCVFTLGELDRLLRGNGFVEAYRMELPYYGKESPVVVATRR
jgi:ubiquinone/menaquinone biosynthesis C-methylase UbiE